MPELPEVEIVKQSLNKKIKGKIIKKVEVKNRNLRLKVPLKFTGILSLKSLFLIITLFTVFCLIFLFKDCLMTSTSGNSGI